MASLKEIRNRVKSVKNTQKITRAMKLVAAAKLRRAQDAAEAARPYADRMRAVIGTLASSVDPSFSPLFRREEVPQRSLVVILSSDRGLCGGFNSTLFRRTKDFLRENAANLGDVTLVAVGRKGSEFIRREQLGSISTWVSPTAEATLAVSRQVTQTAVSAFNDGTYDRVFVAYNRFQSALSQVPTFEQILPLDPAAFGQGQEGEGPDYIFEPSREELLAVLLPQFLDTQVYGALLESVASEFGARMTAMDNATNNANDIIDKLTLEMNRARQAMITTELSEITAGSEALKG